jgi:hypothetical protein
MARSTVPIAEDVSPYLLEDFSTRGCISCMKMRDNVSIDVSGDYSRPVVWAIGVPLGEIPEGVSHQDSSSEWL